MKASYHTWATCLEQVPTHFPHLQTRDSGTLSHVSGYAPTRFGLGRIGCAPKGPTQASNVAQVQPISNMTYLCAYRILMFFRQEQHSCHI
jgi:hypothetical protein